MVPLVGWFDTRRQISFNGLIKADGFDAFRVLMNDKVLPGEPVEILFNSGGGDNTVMESFINLIESYKAEGSVVRMIGMGLVASCGVPIFASGSKGERYLFENTDVMLHMNTAPVPDGKTSMTLKEAEGMAKSLRDEMMRYASRLATNCDKGEGPEWWSDMMENGPTERHITAADAVKDWKIGDHVIAKWPQALSSKKLAKAA